MLKNTRFAYLDFDDEQLLAQFDEDKVMQSLHEIYPDYQYLLLDEIQNLPGWDMWVSKLYRRGENLVITGSNSNMLSSEMASLLTGRYLPIEILPFSLGETLEYRHIGSVPTLPAEKADFMLQVEDYLYFGGYPETINNRSIARTYLSSLFDSIILKDIVRRHKVRKADELYRLVSYLLSIFAGTFTYASLMEDLQINSKTTVQKFCRYLSESYLLFYLPRFNNKMKLMQKAPQKIYVVDNGFLSANAFQISQNKGRLLENLVFMELLRRGYETGKHLFYYRNRKEQEVDFVVREGTQVRQMLQVCYQFQDARTENREITSLTECAADFHSPELIIITWDTEREVNVRGYIIHIVPFYKWALAF